MALVDMLGVASIMPFMSLLSNPNLLEQNELIRFVYAGLGFKNVNDFNVFFGICVLAMMVISLFVRAFTSFVIIHFVLMREYSIGLRLLEGYLRMPYLGIASRNSADISKTILSEVKAVIGGCLMPLMNMAAHGTVVIALVTLLFLANPKIALTISFVIGLSYLTLYYFASSYLTFIGKERLAANFLRYKILNECLGSIKEVKYSSKEDVFIGKFSAAAYVFARYLSIAKIVGQIPRYGLELIAFGGLLTVIIFYLSKGENIFEILPLLTLYAFAGYRLLPSIQQVYNAMTELRFVKPALDQLIIELDFMADNATRHEKLSGNMGFEKELKLENVSFSYDNSDRRAVSNINLSIKPNTAVAFVGKTGSGKSTLLDIIVGLIDVAEGTFILDGKTATRQDMVAFRERLGYVPQDVFLLDDTIQSNIAFGVEPEKIDDEQITKIARAANIDEFVSELPDGYQTLVGERGVRLSGGQIQRIGIARALYNDPDIIVFDEATSALDTLTESSIMESINVLKSEKTIIIISHRLNSVRRCDQIFLMDKGRIVDSGTYKHLYKTSFQFRKMAQS